MSNDLKNDDYFADLPKYLENLPTENIQKVFDAFIDQNYSDEEEFYDNQREIENDDKGAIRKKHPKRKLYKTIEEFESGYEKQYNENAINTILQHKNQKIKKIYLKDVLKLDFGEFNYEFPKASSLLLNQPQRKLQYNDFILANLPELNTNNKPKKKESTHQHQNQHYYNKDNHHRQGLSYIFNNKDNLKIMTVSQNLNIKTELLEPYIKNYYKYEDTSDQIELNDPEDKQLKHKCDILYFKETPHEHRVLFGLSLPQLEKRASLLVHSRYVETYKTMSIILKFLVLLKKLQKEGGKKKSISSSNILDGKISKNKTEKMIKVKNTIVSYRNLDNFFQEAKELSTKDLMISNLKSTIGEYEKKRRDEQFISLKEKMRSIINQEDTSIDDYSRIHNSIEDEDAIGIGKRNSNNADEVFNLRNRDSKRKNKKGNSIQSDMNYNEALPEFIPQHQSRFKKDLKSYIQSQIKGKK